MNSSVSGNFLSRRLDRLASVLLLLACLFMAGISSGHAQDSPSGLIPGAISIVAGNGTGPDNGAAAISAGLPTNAGKFAVDSKGNIYLTFYPGSTGRFAMYMIYGGQTPVPPVLTAVVSGAPQAGYIYQLSANAQCTTGTCGDGSTLAQASFNNIVSMFFDSSDNLYVSDGGAFVVREVSYATRIVTTVAGQPFNESDGSYDLSQPVLATGTPLNCPQDAKADTAGNVYIADACDNVVRVVYNVNNLTTGVQVPLLLSLAGFPSPQRGYIYTPAGAPGGTSEQYCQSDGACGDGGSMADALFGGISSIDIDSAGNLYVLDNGDVGGIDPTVRLIYAGTTDGEAPPLLSTVSLPPEQTGPQPGYIYLIAGSAATCSTAPCGDGGPALRAQFNNPIYLRIDSTGNVYVADFGDSTVRKVDEAGYISSVAGVEAPNATSRASTGGGGPAISAVLYQPNPIAFDALDNLYLLTAHVDGETGTLLWEVTPATPQTIDFPAFTTPVTYGVIPITLDAIVTSTPNSGNPVTYSVTGPATLSNSTLTVTGVGTVTVTASVAGTAITNYVQGDPIYAAASVSQSFTVDQATQTILFGSLPSNVIYGTSPITVSATSDTPNSSNPVTLAVTGPASLSSSTSPASMTITGAGPVSVTANQAGNANYTAGSATESFTATPAGLTVTANSQSRQYGQPNPSLTYSIAPFVNGDTQVMAISGVPSVTTTATQTSPAGVAYPITITQGGLTANATIPGYPNYTFTAFNNGTLTVTGGLAQAITFTQPLPNVIYGASLITLNATSNSGLAVTYTVTGPANFGGLATTTAIGAVTMTVSGAGPVTVTASQPGNADYATATSVSRSFAVAPAVLTVAATSFSQTTVPTTLTYGITGFVPGDSQATATTGAPSLSTTATSASAPGNYSITITQGTLAANATIPNNPNYTFNLVNGTLTLLSRTAQAISFSPLPNVTYGTSSIALDAIANSGLAVTYTVTGPANFGGSATTTATGPVTLAVTGAGLVSIITSQPGNAVYAPAQAVTQTFQVVPVALTVTAPTVTLPYGTTINTAQFPAPSITGFVNGDTQALVTGSAAYTSTVTGTTPSPGSYPISVAIGTLALPSTIASNYTFAAFHQGTLNVTIAPQTITFAALPTVMTYGDQVVLAAKASSGLPITLTVTGAGNFYNSGSVIVTNPTVGTAYYEATGTGTVTITASQSGNSDYGAAPFVTQTHTVNPATLIVLANSFTREYGAANPTLTYLFPASANYGVGFQNGDSDIPSVITGLPVLTTTATSASPAGTYPIVITQGILAALPLSSPNYAFQFVNGTLTILPPGGYTITTNPSSLTIARGQSAQSIVTITPSNLYQGTVTLSCGQLPANVSCTISPATYIFPGNQTGGNPSENPALGTITINTTAATVVGALSAEKSSLRLAGLLIPGALAGLFLLFARRRVARASAIWSLCALLAFGLGALAVTSCGGSSGLTTAATGTQTITLTGTGTTPSGGTVTATAPLTVTIQ